MDLRQWTSLLAGALTALGLAGGRNASSGQDAYLGQKPPGMTAEVFAPGLVSTSSFEHSRLEISKDGRAMYWVVQPIRGKQVIWTTRRQPGGGWSKPAPLPISNGAEALPFLSWPALAPDGRTLYFFSIKLGMTHEHGAPADSTLYSVDLENPRWDAPASVTPWFPNAGSVWGYSFAANGNLYFDSGDRLYWMRKRGGFYDPPKKLGNAVIDDGDGFAPFVAPDESYLLFSAQRSDSVGNPRSIDLYVSFRRADGSWGPPANLGPSVNTSVNERFPSVSPDGKHLFFLRNDPYGDADFYWVNAAVVTRLKER